MPLFYQILVIRVQNSVPHPLTGVKGYKAATVNAYLAPIRARLRTQGRTLKVEGVKQVQGLAETLDARAISAGSSTPWMVRFGATSALWR